MKRKYLYAGGSLTESKKGFRAVLIREGVSKNGNNWKRRIIEGMVAIANGVPVRLFDASPSGDHSFLTHWEVLRRSLPPGIRKLLPSRLDNAVVGKTANAEVRIVDGVAQLEADIESTGQRAQILSRLIRKAQNFGRSLGLSIHVDPDDLDSNFIESGIEPTAVREIAGFDIVTHPSAGGAFLPVLEAWSKEEKGMKDLVKKLLRLLSSDQRKALIESVEMPPEDSVNIGGIVRDYPEFVGGLFEALDLEAPEGAEIAILEALAKEPEPNTNDSTWDDHGGRQNKKGGKERKRMLRKASADPNAESKKKGATESDNRLDLIEKRTEDLLRRASRSIIESAVKDSDLPKSLAKFARDRFEGILESQGYVEEDDVTSFIADLKKALGKTDNLKGGVQESVSQGVSIQWSSGERAQAALQALLDGTPHGILESADGKEKTKVPAFRGIRQAYGVITGDVYCEGRDFFTRDLRNRPRGVWEDIDWERVPVFREFRALRGGHGVMEAMTTANFPLLLADVMHRSMLRDYRQQSFKWRLIAVPISVPDFRTQHYYRDGEFANLSVVNEAAAYLDDLGTPTEDEITLQIEKKGGIAVWTWEMLVNDDLNRFRRFPSKIARAADRTLTDEVFTHLTANGAIYDAVALAAAGHNNIETTAYSFANIKSLRKKMHLQQDLDSKEPERAVPRGVLVGPDLFDQAYEDMFTDGLPTLTGTNTNEATPTDNTTTIDSERKPNVLRSKYGLYLEEVQQFGTGAAASADDYWVVSSPADIDMIRVGFLNGREDPELFVQDLERVGSFFTNDQITQKVRHVYKSEVMEYRGFGGGIVP